MKDSGRRNMGKINGKNIKPPEEKKKKKLFQTSPHYELKNWKGASVMFQLAS